MAKLFLFLFVFGFRILAGAIALAILILFIFSIHSGILNAKTIYQDLMPLGGVAICCFGFGNYAIRGNDDSRSGSTLAFLLLLIWPIFTLILKAILRVLLKN